MYGHLFLPQQQQCAWGSGEDTTILFNFCLICLSELILGKQNDVWSFPWGSGAVPGGGAGIPASLGSAVTQAWVPGLLSFFICNIGYCHLQYIMTSSKLNDEIKHLAHRRHSSKSRIFLSFHRPEVAPPFFLLSFPASLLIQNGFFSFCKQVKDLIG